MLNAEADGLPGLLIDRYADTLVLQSICQGSDRILDEVVDILRREYAPAQIIVRNDHPERRREGLDTNVNILHGSTEGLINYEEGSLRLSINALSGDVTGTYLDQQRNHQWVSSFAHGRGLDLYCYSGGFALHMAQRCNSILAVDNAASPLTLGELDGQSNQLDNVSWHNNDVMAFLESANRSGETFDSIVVDPPGNIDSDTYEQILGRVFRVAQVRAFVLVFTRRYPMQRQQFEHQVLHTAAESGRRVQLLARRGPSWDHPILATLPETELLAGLLLRLV
jgi:23S rRNA (cytosine1962-C5)-methyltransferase